MRFTLATPALALILGSCSPSVTLYDVAGVREPSVAFIVYFRDGEAVKTSGAITITEEGLIDEGSNDQARLESETALVIIGYEALRTAAGDVGHTLLPENYAQARLLTEPLPLSGLQKLDNEVSVWLGRVPSDVQVQPLGRSRDFLRELQLQLPTISDSQCSRQGVLRDVDPSGGLTGEFLDVLPVAERRALVVRGEEILDIRLNEDGSYESTSFTADSRFPTSRYQRIAANPAAGRVIYATRALPDSSTALDQFRLLDEGLDWISTTTITSIMGRSLVVSGADGDVLVIGNVPNTLDVASVWVEDGVPQRPVYVDEAVGDRTIRLVGPTEPEGSVYTGTKGAVHIMDTRRRGWRRDPLSDNTTGVRVNGLVQRVKQDNSEVWIAADNGRIFRRLADGDPQGQKVLTPPNFSCIDSDMGSLGLNLMDIDIVGETNLALIALESCNELLVFDMDGGQCASSIPYVGTAMGSLPRRVRVLDKDVWTVGLNFVRYASIE